MRGEDSKGTSYDNIEQLWDDKSEWYKHALDYWEGMDASVDGVLAGHASLSPADLVCSRVFLEKLARLPEPPSFGYALDCGAGIGRVTKGLLLKKFDTVDLLEPIAKYIEKAKHFVDSPQAKEFFECSLQEFEFPQGRYDVVWAQWCVLYLTDADLVKFIQDGLNALKKNGVLVIKENVITDSTMGFHVDRDDNSLMRPSHHYKRLFKEAGAELLLEMDQTHFPSALFPVKLYALR